MHNIICSLDNIKGNMQHAKLKRLEFHAIWDKGKVYRGIFDKVEWFYYTQSIYLSQQLEFNTEVITYMYIFHIQT